MAFNEFDVELEDASMMLLEKIVGSSLPIQFSRYPPIQVDGLGFSRAESQRLFRRSPGGLVDQLVVYALVSLIDTGEAEKQADEIRRIHRLLRDNARTVGRAFAFGGTTIRTDAVVIKLGCISFSLKGFWSMYKAEWSESISRAQCN